ncbi:TVP38/TMEM64 family protein [Granulosicoccus antarcticus]|uniref:TVP38/TMEM64 family membrane protein n=1 Tax=Granulosicoccus antarcticus IMCC3135 TaxID=1192854 RepID=A0A2Z2P120_9GAMM|nr:TVP38/TMEM64 family protein [Granulosicoccus antarcticus]ASJ76101.1 TVP38/TMEM64 family inner membrane protein YdjZ [Granulosicoccus antarcticus IMCC3135]
MAMNNDQQSGFSWKWVIVAVVLIGVTAAWFLLPAKEWLDSFSSWIKELGPLGWLLFGLVYIVGTIVLAPGSVFSIAAGLTFGAWGYPLVVVSATIGAAIAFIIARHLARDRVRKKVDNSPKFAAIDNAVSEDGWKIVALMRLSPAVPFNLQNYFFGVTDVSFWHYVAATFVGILPGTALYVYLGAIGSAAGGDSGGPAKWVFFGVGLLATIVVVVLVTRKAKAKLDDYGVDDEKNEDSA